MFDENTKSDFTAEDIGAEVLQGEIAKDALDELRSEESNNEIKKEVAANFRKVFSLNFEEKRKHINSAVLNMRQEFIDALAECGCENPEEITDGIIDKALIRDIDEVCDKSEADMNASEEDLNKRLEIVDNIAELTEQHKENSRLNKKIAEAKINKINRTQVKINALNALNTVDHVIDLNAFETADENDDDSEDVDLNELFKGEL